VIPTDYDFTVRNLGERKIASRVKLAHYVADDRRILFNIELVHCRSDATRTGEPLSVEVAGPRETLFFDPSQAKAAIITCGGLCPGINNVIRAVVMELYHRYGVKNIIGVRYGFQGLISRFGHDMIELTPEAVKDIHTVGGSFLSSSRGKQDIAEMVDTLKRKNIDILFCIGGDGTMRAAEAIDAEIVRRKLNISIIGIPKTIDNDLNLIQKTFGYDTAIAEAMNAIKSAHVEAKGAPMGIGLVKIMGRQSGHIAVGAALALSEVNFVLIPEVPFELEGERGFLKALRQRLTDRQHAVILVAEGAGQELFCDESSPPETDASGNIKLKDVGLFLKDRIEHFFKQTGMEINLKYIDPSYMIRSVPANASDSVYCGALGQYAVHAGMAGKTGMLVGLMRDEFVHLPLQAVTSGRKVDPGGNLWMRVLESTGQPPMIDTGRTDGPA